MTTPLSQLELDQENIKRKLLEFGVSNKCPVSGHNDWTLVKEFVSVVSWNGENKSFTFNSAYPAVMLACGGCGYMALFSAVKLGLVNRNGEGTDE